MSPPADIACLPSAVHVSHRERFAVNARTPCIYVCLMQLVMRCATCDAASVHCRFGYAGLPWTNFVSIDDDRAYSPPNAIITNSPFAQMGCGLNSAALRPVGMPWLCLVVYDLTLTVCRSMRRTDYGQGFNLHSFYIQPYCRSFLKVNMYGYYRVSIAEQPLQPRLSYKTSGSCQYGVEHHQ